MAMSNIITRFMTLLLLIMWACSGDTSKENRTEDKEIVEENNHLRLEEPEAHLTSVLTSDGSLNTFNNSVVSTGLDSTLSNKSQITIFAPTQQGFENLNEKVLEDLQDPEQKGFFREVLLNHVIEGIIKPGDIKHGATFTSMNDDQLIVQEVEGKMMINGAVILNEGKKFNNGILYKVDKVMLPVIK